MPQALPMPMPQQAPGNAVQPGAQPGQDPSAQSAQMLAAAKAQFQKASESMSRLEAVRKAMDKLADLGDSVSPEDVIKEAGTLVGSGFSPQALAQLLSQMPTDAGQGLQAWVGQQEQRVQQQEQAMAPQMEQSSHLLGVAALTHLKVLHSQGVGAAQPSPEVPSAEQPGPPSPPAAMGNALTLH